MKRSNCFSTLDQPSTEKISFKHRSRSNTTTSTKSRKRPQSRASTTSIHSGITQPVIEQQIVEPGSHYPKQWYQHDHAHQRFESISHQMTPEDMVIHSASQLQNPGEYEIDPALGGVPNQTLTYPNDAHYKHEHGRLSLPVEAYGANYGEGDSQLLEGRSDEQDEVESLAGGPAKKASKSSAANELEMRQLFHSNKHRSLPDIAAELHGNERGPQSERQRQVFAMLWYLFSLSKVRC
jgi:regulatory factor X